MATQKKDSANATKSVSVDASRFVKDAKNLASVINKWYGISPEILQAGLNSRDLPTCKVEEIAGTPLIILGFTKMIGEDKKTKVEREFLLVMATKGADPNAFTFFASQLVVMKKLNQASQEENAFPLKCMIEKRTGKDQTYYDLVA